MPSETPLAVLKTLASPEQFTRILFERLSAKYQISVRMVNYTPQRVRFSTDALPILPFLLEAADWLKVPVERIECESATSELGCSSCGYGAGFTFDWIYHLKDPTNG